MPSIWKGALSFGLVNIPIRVYSAAREHSIDFDMLHEKDLSPIHYARICEAERKEVPYQEIVKGYEYEKGEYIVLTDEDFKRANPKKTSTLEILQFSEEEEIDPIYFEKPYVEELKALIKQKAQGKKAKPKKRETIEFTPVHEMMSKLKASLDSHRHHQASLDRPKTRHASRRA
jgi:non-homologous end joining protein Ku